MLEKVIIELRFRENVEVNETAKVKDGVGNGVGALQEKVRKRADILVKGRRAHSKNLKKTCVPEHLERKV